MQTRIYGGSRRRRCRKNVHGVEIGDGVFCGFGSAVAGFREGGWTGGEKAAGGRKWAAALGRELSIWTKRVRDMATELK